MCINEPRLLFVDNHVRSPMRYLILERQCKAVERIIEEGSVDRNQEQMAEDLQKELGKYKRDELDQFLALKDGAETEEYLLDLGELIGSSKEEVEQTGLVKIEKVKNEQHYAAEVVRTANFLKETGYLFSNRSQ